MFPSRSSPRIPAARSITAVISTLAVIFALAPVVNAAPSEKDFSPRRTIDTWANVISANYQGEIAVAPDGRTFVAYLRGWTGYVAERAPGSTTWSKPRALTIGTVYDPEIAVGKDGTVAVLFARTGSGAQVFVRPAGTTGWEQAQDVRGSQPTLAVGHDGAVMVLSSAFQASVRHYIVVSARRAPGRGKAFGSQTLISAPNRQGRTPRPVVLANGRFAVTWSEEAPNSRHDAVKLAVTTSAKSNSWRSYELAKATPTWHSLTNPVLANSGNSVSVMWQERNSNNTHHQIRSRTLRANGTLEPIQTMRSSEARRPRFLNMVATGNGTIVAAWGDDEFMRSRHRSPGAAGWSALNNLGNTF